MSSKKRCPTHKKTPTLTLEDGRQFALVVPPPICRCQISLTRASCGLVCISHHLSLGAVTGAPEIGYSVIGNP